MWSEKMLQFHSSTTACTFYMFFFQQPNSFILWWKSLCMMILFNNGNHTRLLDANKLLHTWAHCLEIKDLHANNNLIIIHLNFSSTNMQIDAKTFVFARKSMPFTPLWVETLIGCHLPIGCQRILDSSSTRNSGTWTHPTKRILINILRRNFCTSF